MPVLRGASQSGTADIDAPGCLRAIRTAPLGPGAEMEVKVGAVVCVLTAAASPQLVLVEITEVGTTGTAGMRATSWSVARWTGVAAWNHVAGIGI